METFAQLFQIRSQTLRKPCLGSKGERIMSPHIAPSWGGPAQGHLLLPPPRTLCGYHWKSELGALDTPHIPHPTQREWEGKQLVQTEGASGPLLLSWAHPAGKTDSMRLEMENGSQLWGAGWRLDRRVTAIFRHLAPCGSGGPWAGQLCPLLSDGGWLLSLSEPVGSSVKWMMMPALPSHSVACENQKQNRP